MVGNRRSQNSAPRWRASSHMCGWPVSMHPAHDRLGDHVARREVGELVDALHEPVALEVDEERALAADRLGDQRLLAAGVGAEVHHGRVELHELQVARAWRRPAARAPSRRRSRPRGWWSGRTPGRDRRWRARPRGSAPRRRRRAGPRRSRAGSPRRRRRPRRAAGRRRARAGSTSISGASLDRGDQRPLDLGAGGVAAGVRDPVAVVAALAGQRQLAVGVVVEVGAERDQLADGVGALGHQDVRPRLEVAGAGARPPGCRARAARGCPRGRARRRCRPAPTAWSRRRARPW